MGTKHEKQINKNKDNNSENGFIRTERMHAHWVLIIILAMSGILMLWLVAGKNIFLHSPHLTRRNSQAELINCWAPASLIYLKDGQKHHLMY